ncbi:hypothetical protein INR49_009950 [Caranx melampygus]|nr:hypothetical protein INR49_009950 [Caranx melampygus]
MLGRAQVQVQVQTEAQVQAEVQVQVQRRRRKRFVHQASDRSGSTLTARGLRRVTEQSRRLAPGLQNKSLSCAAAALGARGAAAEVKLCSLQLGSSLNPELTWITVAVAAGSGPAALNPLCLHGSVYSSRPEDA